MTMTSQCDICGRDKVSDYPECYHVEKDYPEVSQMENMGMKRAIVSAFKTVQSVRCQFMHWLISTGIAVPDGELFKLPENLSLRPQAMLDLEHEIIMRGILVGEKSVSDGSLNKTIADYVNRATTYFQRCYEKFGEDLTASVETEA